MSETRVRYRAGTLKDGSISHRAFAAQVVAFARLQGWLVYFTWRSIHSPSGFPDLVLVRPAEGLQWIDYQSLKPRLIFAELKCGRDKVRPAQQEWLDALRAAGIPCYVWTPANWSEVERVLGGPNV